MNYAGFILALGNLILVGLSIKLLRILFKLKSLSAVSKLSDQNASRVSIVIAARNEAAHLEEALKRLCGLDYPNFEIVVVNDRSDDGTGEILKSMAAQNSRVIPVTIEDLPQGWLGKSHALHRGMSHATGEWVLITDGDVYFRADAVRIAMNWVLSNKLDFLAVLPDLITPSFWVGVTIWTFAAHLLSWVDPDKLADPQAPDYFGVGACNLMRRSTYDRTQGFSGLKLDASEDVGIARLFKQAGGKIGLATGGTIVQTAWYDSLADLQRGFEHTSLGIAGYRVRRVFYLATLMLLLAITPMAAAANFFSLPLVALAIGAYLTAVAVATYARRLVSVPFTTTLLVPMGHAILFWALLRAALLGWWRGGLKWRGTFYSFRQLRGESR